MSHDEGFFKFSARILDHLGISAYNSVQKCVSELLANAYDADATEVRVSLPDAIDENAVIEITDTGTGMDVEELKNKFLFLGRNRRGDGEITKGGRLVIGSKGIGKLAGFGISSKIHLITWKARQQSSITLDRDAFNDVESLSSKAIPILHSQSEHSCGTQIRLMQLHRELRLPPAETLRRHLFKTLPQKPDFRIYVNEIECSAEDIPGDQHSFQECIEDAGNVRGFYIIANARQANPGFVIRVRGRVVTEPSLFGLDTRSHGFFTAEKIVGEINADFLDPDIPNREGHIDLINTSRDGFLEDAQIIMKLNEWASSFIEKIVRGVDASEEKRRTDALLERTEIKERLEKMPPHIRGRAKNVIKGIINKLKNVEEDEAARLIEWVLRYYESNILRELMDAIIAADVSDAEKLAELIQEWGLKQVNGVVGIITEQIDIINKLEELIESNKSYEIEVHKLIESNLWLVREGLELWSSDKPLKTVLDSRIDELYKDRQNIRPDLVCRSRNDGNDAVILEFKRPKERVVMEHVTQALEYEAIIKKHRPNMSFSTYVVGLEYDQSVLAARDKLEQASLYLWSLQEIIQKTRIRFESILEILGR